MSYSINDVTATAGQTAFAVPFPYLHDDDVHVFIDGVVCSTFEFTSPSAIHLTLDDPLLGGEVVRVRRITPVAELIAIAVGRGFVKSSDWNLVNTQLLYAIQEALDSANNAEGLVIDLEAQVAAALALLAAVQAILADLRYSYDVAIAAYDLFLINERAGPVPVTKAVTMPVGLTNSQFKVFFAPPDGDQILSIRKNDTQIGTLTIAQTTGDVTVFFPTQISLAPGDSLSLVTTQAGGLLSFGVTFACSRT